MTIFVRPGLWYGPIGIICWLSTLLLIGLVLGETIKPFRRVYRRVYRLFAS